MDKVVDADTVSIIVPVYNDPDGIRTTIESIRPHILDVGGQLVVVDNNSTDHTPEIIEKYAGDDNVLHLIENEVQSSYAARNTGIRNAHGDILGFIDADMTVPDNWLNSVIAEFRSSEIQYQGCKVELRPTDRSSFISRYDVHTGFPVRNYIENQYFAPTCCLFVHRSVFEDVGLFDHRLISAGDKEFGNRVYDAGYDLHYAEDVTVHHPTRNALSDLLAKDLRVGRGLCQIQRYHPDRYGSPGIPPRPSGAKSPESSIAAKDRLTFGVLGKMFTGVRALGYYRELFSPTDTPDIDDIPTLN